MNSWRIQWRNFVTLNSDILAYQIGGRGRSQATYEDLLSIEQDIHDLLRKVTGDYISLRVQAIPPNLTNLTLSNEYNKDLLGPENGLILKLFNFLLTSKELAHILNIEESFITNLAEQLCPDTQILKAALTKVNCPDFSPWSNSNDSKKRNSNKKFKRLHSTKH